MILANKNWKHLKIAQKFHPTPLSNKYLKNFEKKILLLYDMLLQQNFFCQNFEKKFVAIRPVVATKFFFHNLSKNFVAIWPVVATKIPKLMNFVAIWIVVATKITEEKNFVATIFDFVATMVRLFNNSRCGIKKCIFGNKKCISGNKGQNPRECRYNKNRHATKGIERYSNVLFNLKLISTILQFF